MAVRPIKIFPDGVLSSPTQPFTQFGPSLKSLVEDLFDTLYASPGVGLAAPQIGVLRRVSVVDVSKRPLKKGLESSNQGPLVLINPVMVRGEGRQVPREGCLSVPEFLANVTRFHWVQIKAQDVQGEWRVLEAMGFEALAFQHEIDHLEGKLFLDRVTNIKTDVFRRKMF